MLFFLLSGAAICGGFVGYWVSSSGRILGTLGGAVALGAIGVNVTGTWGALPTWSSLVGFALGCALAYVGGRLVVGR